jgi:hypothetical protein
MSGGFHFVIRFLILFSHGKSIVLILDENQAKNWFQGFHPCENQLAKPELQKNYKKRIELVFT